MFRSGLSDTQLPTSYSNRSSPTRVAFSDDNSASHSEESDGEAFVYPGAAQDSLEPSTSSTLTPSGVHTPAQASPAQLEALYAAASSGDLSVLQRRFHISLQNGDVEAFALANDASSRTGLTALHAAASRGYIDIVQWCEC
jgi:hypothetical protein